MLAGEGPRRTASSASFTWRDSSSQSEYPTTARIPNSRQGRTARQAISPRVAMKIFRKAGRITLLDIPSRQDLKGFPVFFRCLPDHVRGELRPGRGLVPRKRQQIIADELLVEALLRAARPIAVRGPEPRRVRRQHLVDQDELPVRQPELELGVGDDDSPPAGVVRRPAVDLQRDGARLLGHRFPDDVDHLRKGDVHVVLSLLLLGGGGEDRLREPCRLEQPYGDLDPADLPSLAVFRPSGAGQVPAHDALDGKRLRLPAEHRTTYDSLLVSPGGGGKFLRVARG